MRVETTFQGGFDPHLIRIKMAAFSQTWWESEVDTLSDAWSNPTIQMQQDNMLAYFQQSAKISSRQNFRSYSNLDSQSGLDLN